MDLTFKLEPFILGKPLDSPKLRDFKIVPSLSVKDGITTLSLTAPEKHAKLVHWGLIKDGKFLEPGSYVWTVIPGRADLYRTYRGEHREGMQLGLTIAEPIDQKIFEFNFRNVALP